MSQPSAGDMVDGGPTSRRDRIEAATRRILDATYDALIDLGYGHMTVDDIAELAGVSKATIYRRWTSKQELVVAACASRLPPAEVPDLGSFREEFRYLLRDRIAYFRSGDMTRRYAGLLASVAEDETTEATLARNTELLNESSATIIERGKTRGDVRTDVDTDVLRYLMPATLVFTSMLARKIPDDDFLDELVDLVVRGIEPRL